MSIGISGALNLQYLPATGTFTFATDMSGVTFSWNNVPVLTSTLPTAAVAGAGARALVGDATTVTFRATLVGTGTIAVANTVPVYSDGTNWKVG